MPAVAASSATLTIIAVVVDGRPVVADYEVLGFDEAAGRRQAQAQFDNLLASYPQRTPGYPALSRIFPPTFPIVRRGGHPMRR